MVMVSFSETKKIYPLTVIPEKNEGAFVQLFSGGVICCYSRAPAARRSFTHSVCPALAAAEIGVSPS